MRTRVLLAAILAVTASGCIVHNEAPPPAFPGDITVQWSFSDNNGCFDINRINVAIPGQFSQDFNCLDGAEVITNFDPGSYQVTVTAFNSANQVAYQGTTDFVVNGDVHVNVVMTPQIVAAPGDITVLWTFTDGDNCIGIDHIHIDIPGENIGPGDYACNTAGTQGITLTNFDPGSYSITVTAVDGNGAAAYQGSTTAVVNGNVSVPVSLTSVGVAGDLTLLWTFPGGVSCSGAGVDHVVVTIPGENLGSGAGVGVAYNCNTAGTQGVTLADFAPGAYGVSLSARTAGETELYSSSGTVEVNGNVSYTFSLQ